MSETLNPSDPAPQTPNSSKPEFKPQGDILIAKFHCPHCERRGSAATNSVKDETFRSKVLEHAIRRFREITGCTHPIQPGPLVRNSDWR